MTHARIFLPDNQLNALCVGEAALVWLRAGVAATTGPQPAGLLSGAFNPLHAGHLALREAAARHLGGDVCFELPVVNADKPPLAAETIRERAGQFREDSLVLTRSATFAEKSLLFPQTVFVVGWDTAVRVLEPRFYGGVCQNLLRSLETIRDAGCRFLVAGRTCNQVYRTGSALEIPAGCHELFEELPAAKFRMDISSTEIREQHAERP